MYQLIAYLTLISSCYGYIGLKSLHTDDPEIRMNASELITSKGYPCEEYTVRTEDGFLLGLQRIPHGLKPQPKKGVVFLQHGLLCSSTNWLTNLANQSLGFILADAGYDVWLGNVRGNTYSRRHVKFSPDQAEFWAWSWDEMAEYDIPAMIEFALARSNASRLHYVGHSQGTLVMFANLAENPRLAGKIALFQALGPVATVGHIVSPLKRIADLSSTLQELFRILGVHDFLPSSWLLRYLGRTVCEAGPWGRDLCGDALFLLAGFDRQQLNETRLPVYIGHTPAGTSVQNMVHFAQGVKSGQFQKYDYGSAAANQQHYGQSTPPLYNPRNVAVPVALYYAQNDWLADPQDVTWLLPQLKRVVHSEEIPQWDHLDFIWGMDAATILYPRMIKLMEQYN